MDFAPRNEGEIGLLRFLSQRFGTVSLERVLSGPGLVNLYHHVREQSGKAGDPGLVEELERSCDPGGGIAPKILPQLRAGRWAARLAAGA